MTRKDHQGGSLGQSGIECFKLGVQGWKDFGNILRCRRAFLRNFSMSICWSIHDPFTRICTLDVNYITTKENEKERTTKSICNGSESTECKWMVRDDIQQPREDFFVCFTSNGSCRFGTVPPRWISPIYDSRANSPTSSSRHSFEYWFLICFKFSESRSCTSRNGNEFSLIGDKRGYYVGSYHYRLSSSEDQCKLEHPLQDHAHPRLGSESLFRTIFSSAKPNPVS